MKLTLTIISAALLATPMFSATGDVSVVQGCEIVDMGGYSNKVDPTCSFNKEVGGGGGIDLSIPQLPGESWQDYLDRILS